MATSHHLALLAALPLLAVGLSQPAHATSFRVDAESDSSTIVTCRGGRCINCSNCHVGAATSAKTAVPNHGPKLVSKYQYRLAEGQKLKLDKTGYLVKEKGRLVVYDGKNRRVLPASTVILKDGGGRAAVYITED